MIQPPYPRPDLRRMVERLADLRVMQSRTDAICQEDWWTTRQITPLERVELRNLERTLVMESEDTPIGYQGIRVDLGGGWASVWVPDADEIEADREGRTCL